VLRLNIDEVVKPRKQVVYSKHAMVRRARIMGEEDWQWHRYCYPQIKPRSIYFTYMNINKRLSLAGYVRK
jgi:hypothetical protein